MIEQILQAARPALAAAFTLWGGPVTWLEIVAFALSIAMVLANLRVDPVGWPLAIVSSLLYALLFVDSKLYGEASLQLFFVVVSVWGWWQWLRAIGDDGAPLRVHRLARAQAIRATLATLAAWPLAIVSSLLYFALFWNSRLYGDASLQIFFALVAAWGWWQWLRGTAADGTALSVTWLPARARWALVGVMALAWPATGLFLRRYTDTDVPWWDAFPTAGSVIGQWLLGRKHVENWAVWVAVNVVSVALFAYKGLWLTVLLYAVFIALSAQGWRSWTRLAPAR